MHLSYKAIPYLAHLDPNQILAWSGTRSLTTLDSILPEYILISPVEHNISLIVCVKSYHVVDTVQYPAPEQAEEKPHDRVID